MCRFAHLGNLQTISAKKGNMGSMSSIGLFIRRKRFIFLWAVALLAVALPCTKAQTANGLSGDAIVDHLNAAIDWYRQVTSRVPTAGLPSDAVYQFNAQNMAAGVPVCTGRGGAASCRGPGIQQRRSQRTFGAG
jgi:hypothetical protein